MNEFDLFLPDFLLKISASLRLGGEFPAILTLNISAEANCLAQVVK